MRACERRACDVCAVRSLRQETSQRAGCKLRESSPSIVTGGGGVLPADPTKQWKQSSERSCRELRCVGLTLVRFASLFVLRGIDSRSLSGGSRVFSRLLRALHWDQFPRLLSAAPLPTTMRLQDRGDELSSSSFLLLLMERCFQSSKRAVAVPTVILALTTPQRGLVFFPVWGRLRFI